MNNKKNQNTSNERLVKALEIVCFILPFAFGLYYEFAAYAAAAVLTVLLVLFAISNKRIRVAWNYYSLIILFVVIMYGASSLYGVDSGMAFLTFLKYLGILIYALLIMQVESGDRTRIIMNIPIAGGLMTLLCIVSYFTGVIDNITFVADRMSGFFQYANTFALFLLVGIVLLCYKKEKTKLEYFNLLLLVAGILWSGSRSVFILALIAALVVILMQKRWKLLICGVGLMAGIGVLTYFIPALTQTVGRVFTSSLHSSTLLGRLLYSYDAMSIIIDHPFGLGGYGYSFIQDYYANGVYSTTYVHNDLVQCVLDIGIIPALVVASGCLIWLFNRIKNKRMNHIFLIALIMMLHGLVDFDMQFAAILMIFITVLYPEQANYRLIEKRHMTIAMAGLLIVSVGFVYMAVPSFLFKQENYEKTLSFYPSYTYAIAKTIYFEDTLTDVEKTADYLIRKNSYIITGYEVKAYLASMNKDYKNVAYWQNKAIEVNPFSSEEYQLLADYMIEAMDYYTEKKDMELLDWSTKVLNDIPKRMEQKSRALSYLGKRIKDQPNMQLKRTY